MSGLSVGAAPIVLMAAAAVPALAETYRVPQFFLLDVTPEACGSAAWRGLSSAMGFDQLETEGYNGAAISGGVQPETVRIVLAKADHVSVRAECIGLRDGRSLLSLVLTSDRAGFGYWPRIAAVAVLDQVPAAVANPTAPDPATPPAPQDQAPAAPGTLRPEAGGGLSITW